MKILLVLFLAPLLASAETSPVIDSLKREPASMLDVGMLRLARLTDDFERRVGMYWTAADGSFTRAGAEVSAIYSAADNEITVHFFVMNSVATEAQMKEGCSEAMEQMSIWLRKTLPRMFLHEGTELTPDQLVGLNERFVLQCYVSSDRDSSIGRFWARRTLTDPTLDLKPWE